MWKYCVEVRWRFMRRNLKWWLDPDYFVYTEQHYYKTKAEAKKGYAAVIRINKMILNERKASANNCHEKVIMNRDENGVFLGIEERYIRTTYDCILITMKKVA